VIFGIDALSVKPGLAGAGETYLHELVTHLARVDQENQYCLFTREPCSEWAEAPNLRSIAAPRVGRGALGTVFAEQLWLPLAARRMGVHALLCPAASVPLLWSQPAVVSLQRLLSSHPEFWDTGVGKLHHWRLRVRDRLYRTGVRSSVRRAAAVLAVTDQARREVIRTCGVDPRRIAVAPQGVSDRFRPVDAPQRIAPGASQSLFAVEGMRCAACIARIEQGRGADSYTDLAKDLTSIAAETSCAVTPVMSAAFCSAALMRKSGSSRWTTCRSTARRPMRRPGCSRICRREWTR